VSIWPRACAKPVFSKFDRHRNISDAFDDAVDKQRDSLRCRLRPLKQP
jgi:hypothetical protein